MPIVAGPGSEASAEPAARIDLSARHAALRIDDPDALALTQSAELLPAVHALADSFDPAARMVIIGLGVLNGAAQRDVVLTSGAGPLVALLGDRHVIEAGWDALEREHLVDGASGGWRLVDPWLGAALLALVPDAELVRARRIAASVVNDHVARTSHVVHTALRDDRMVDTAVLMTLDDDVPADRAWRWSAALRARSLNPRQRRALEERFVAAVDASGDFEPAMRHVVEVDDASAEGMLAAWMLASGRRQRALLVGARRDVASSAAGHVVGGFDRGTPSGVPIDVLAQQPGVVRLVEVEACRRRGDSDDAVELLGTLPASPRRHALALVIGTALPSDPLPQGCGWWGEDSTVEALRSALSGHVPVAPWQPGSELLADVLSTIRGRLLALGGGVDLAGPGRSVPLGLAVLEMWVRTSVGGVDDGPGDMDAAIEWWADDRTICAERDLLILEVALLALEGRDPSRFRAAADALADQWCQHPTRRCRVFLDAVQRLAEADPVAAAAALARAGFAEHAARVVASSDDAEVATDGFDRLERLGLLVLRQRLATQARRSMKPVPRGRRSRRPDGLTSVEALIAELVAQGKSNAEVAETTGLSVRTIQGHLSRVYQRFGLDGRGALIAAWSNGTVEGG